ncbi:MAG: SUMF1/EgtB/PvdO family nonheme iron enzyme, partial [Elusimicrobiota bacterium]
YTAGLFATVDDRDADLGLPTAERLGCAPGMVRVTGFKKDWLKTFLVLEDPRACKIKGYGGSAKYCALYDKDWVQEQYVARAIPSRAMDFCIDQFEYPNIPFENPAVMVSFNEAEALCKNAGKRICSDDEWTFACEGEDARPYPYGDGYARDSDACTIDISVKLTSRLKTDANKDDPDGVKTVDKLWAGTPSGSKPHCRSPFGVYDMTGNVDEFTRASVKGRSRYASVMKGGWWGPVRARCQPATTEHNEYFHIYEAGFRCCSAIRR